jgi:hypothetical protein
MRRDCMTSNPDSPRASQPDDPVRARRAIVAKWTNIATRVGYLLFLVAIVMFFVALATDFSSGKVTVITTSMIIGSLLLAPAIVLGYAVKAAEKEDKARGF